MGAGDEPVASTPEVGSEALVAPEIDAEVLDVGVEDSGSVDSTTLD